MGITPGGAWTAPVNVFQHDGIVDNETPRLVQTSDGVIHLMYRTSRNGMPHFVQCLIVLAQDASRAR